MKSAPYRVLFVTSEFFPLVKTGGLADVSAGLPAALRELGADVRVLLPGYRQVLEQLPSRRKVALFSSTSMYFPDAELLACKDTHSDLPLYVLDCPPLYDRDGGPYQDRHGRDWPFNHVRFGLLCHVAARLATLDSPLPWQPNVVHCNDWQAGLAPAYMRFAPPPRAASVITVHNIAFQGIFPPDSLQHLNLPPESFQIQGLEYYGSVSFLKAALYYA
jgi:starch synthase